MKTIFAEFISPKVSKIHHSDPTISSINFSDQLKGITLTENILTKFKLISQGESIDINEEESFQMKIISILLENQDLFSKLNELYINNINETNIDQYLTNLSILSQISPTLDFFNCSNIIDFISSHFYSLDKNKIKKLPKTVIYSIISNQKLKLESEDSLLDFIQELFEDDDKEIIDFYEQIELSQLSENKLIQFAESFNASNMTNHLWAKIRLCFNKKQKNVEINKERYKLITKTIKLEYDGNKSHSMSGIIDYLTKKSGGNVSENGTVKVTSLGQYSDDRTAKNAVDIHNTQNYYETKGAKNSWLIYDFGERKVHPTHYSIRTRHDGDSNHPRNWVIEGSNSGSDNDWTTLDKRQNEATLTGINTTITFDIKEYEGYYKFLRFHQIGNSSSDNLYTAISALEYFGTLIEKEQ